jgi:1-acyl-sn-glycerol-3-phosphate acyltransferase
VGGKALIVGTFSGLAIATSTAILSIPCMLLGLVDPSGRASNAMIRLWARLLLRLGGIRVTIEGAERCPNGPAVFAANHASALDIPVLFAALPCEFRIVYKRSLGHIPLFGWSLWAGRHVAIDRANPFKARRSLDAAAERIRGGISVVVFPEGTRATGGELLPFKRGSFLLAIQAGVPIVPLSLVGVKQRIPRGLMSLTPGAVTIRVHEPIGTAGHDPEKAAQLAESVRAIVSEGLSRA